MTKRKPRGQPWHGWIDRVVEEATERQEFDNLPGYGKPLPDLDRPYDPNRWVRDKMKREDVAGALPPTLLIRKDVHETKAALERMRTEAEVRTALEGLNERIRRVNRTVTSGPPSTTAPLDVERQVRDWQQDRAARLNTGTAGAAGPDKPVGPTAREQLEHMWGAADDRRQYRAADLPRSLTIRKDVQATLAGLEGLGSEVDVRQAVEALNDRIRVVNRSAVSGPMTTVAPLDVDAAVANWRSRSGGD